MARPPRRPVASRRHSGRLAVAVMPVAEREEAQAGDEEERALRNKVVLEFEAALRDQPGMDEEGLEVLMSYFRQAVEDTPLDAELTPPDPDSWVQTLNLMVEGGALKEEDRNSIARQFEEACEPLRDRKVQIALEFAQRVDRDGEEQALAWLREQEQSHEEEQGRAEIPPGLAARPSRQSITQSRSRRLRGPPRG